MALTYAHPDAKIEVGNVTFMGGRWYRIRKITRGAREIHLRVLVGEELATHEKRLAASNRRAAAEMSDAEQVEFIMQFFKYGHLPMELQVVSKPLHDIAREMAESLQPSPELVVGLRKLLEAKDCFVRSRLVI